LPPPSNTSQKVEVITKDDVLKEITDEETDIDSDDEEISPQDLIKYKEYLDISDLEPKKIAPPDPLIATTNLVKQFNRKEYLREERRKKEAKIELDMRADYIRTLKSMKLTESDMQTYMKLLTSKNKKMLLLEGAERAKLMGGRAQALIEGQTPRSKKKKKKEDFEESEEKNTTKQTFTLEQLHDEHRIELGKRRLRWASQVNKALEDTLQYDNKNPRFNEIGIKYVEMNESLRVAYIKWEPCTLHTWHAEELDRVNKMLNHASGFLASRVAARLKVRHAPQMKFYYDLSPSEEKRFLIKPDDKHGEDSESAVMKLHESLKKWGVPVNDKDLQSFKEDNYTFKEYIIHDKKETFYEKKKISNSELKRRERQSLAQKRKSKKKNKLEM
jgi:ribosome-binding factor A